MKYIAYGLMLVVVAGCSCSVGPHVTHRQIDMPSVLKYECVYSDHWYTWDRTIALCDTQSECNDTCAKLERR